LDQVEVGARLLVRLTEKSSADILIHSTTRLLSGRAAFGSIPTRGSIPIVSFKGALQKVAHLFLQKKFRTGAVSEILVDSDQDVHHQANCLLDVKVTLVLFDLGHADVVTKGGEGFKDIVVVLGEGFLLLDNCFLSGDVHFFSLLNMSFGLVGLRVIGILN
jgi:hypothetical protein